MNKKNILNSLFFIISIYVIYLKAPVIFNNFSNQDKNASDFTVQLVTGEDYNLHVQEKKVILVFWATWCGPCEVELKRINQMVIDRKINREDVLAISSNEQVSIVKEKALREKYLFNIGLDQNGKVANLYQIAATPTIIFIDKNKKINWMTTGISPTLEFRVNSFLK